MIKVLHILRDTDSYGVGIWLLSFLKTFDRNRLEITVALPEGSRLGERVEELGIRCIAAEYISERTVSVKAIKSLKTILEEEKPDIVHTHGNMSAKIASKLCNTDIVDTCHFIGTRKSIVKKMIDKIIGANVVVPSKAVFDSLADDGVSPDKMRIIYNGAEPVLKYDDEKRRTVREKYGLDGKLAVGIFADLEMGENHMMLINSASAVYELFPSFRFVIAGEGSLKEELLQEVEDRGISDAVIFQDSKENKQELLNAVDINVITSEHDTNNLSLVEGMKVGKVSVTTDTAGVREIVENGVNGIIIPKDDVVSLTATLLKLAAEPELRKSLSGKALESVEDKFTLEEMCESYTKLYEQI